MSAKIGKATRRRKKDGRGGAREGAGRKPFLAEAKTFSVTLERADYEAVQRLADRRGGSLSSVVRDAVRAYVKRGQR